MPKIVYEAALDPQGFVTGQRAVSKGLGDMEREAAAASRRMTGALSGTRGAFTMMGSAAYDAGRKITSALSGGLSILSKYVALGGVVAGILGGIATKLTILDSAKFESTIGRAAIQSGASPAQRKAMLEHARDVGVETPFGPQAVAEAMFTEAQRGRGVDEIFRLTEATKKFAVIANGDMKTAAETLSQVMFQFGLPMDKAEDTALRLANATAGTALNLEDLFTSLQFAGGAAGIFQVNLTELLAVLGMLRTVADASVSSTAVRNIMLVASAMGNKSDKQLDAMGLHRSDVEGLSFMSGQPKSIMDVVAATRKLAESRPETLMKMGFETRTLPALLQIEKLGPKIEAVRAQIDDLEGAQQKYAQAIELADNQYRRLGNTADAVLLAIGSKLREAFSLDQLATGVSGMLADLSKTISAIPKENVGEIVNSLGAGLIQAFGTAVAFLVQAMVPVAIAFGDLLFRGVTTAAKAVLISDEEKSYVAQYRGMKPEERAAEANRLAAILGGDELTGGLVSGAAMFGRGDHANILRASAMLGVQDSAVGIDRTMRYALDGLKSAGQDALSDLSTNATVAEVRRALDAGMEQRRKDAIERAGAYMRQPPAPSIGILQSGVVNNYGASSPASRAAPARPSGTNRTEAASK